MPSTLLGYDWAAAVADDSRQLRSRAYLDKKDDDDLSSLSAFRRQNQTSCVGPSRVSDLDTEIRSLNPKLDFRRRKNGGIITDDLGDDDVEEAEKRRKREMDNHVCVFPYEIGERLFAKPLTTDKNSMSVVCPVCGKGRPPPPSSSSVQINPASTSSSGPAVVKITLDRRRLLPDYSVPYVPAPRRRKSFDSSNSMSLASHLLKGSRPLRNADVPPMTKSFGLRRNLRKESGGRAGGGGAIEIDERRGRGDSGNPRKT